ncbi:MAG: InlB B-repeat-containing protein [Lachnospiraceae bacterium]|nr:InlB B-repeat-containing protein [Lachnospiraceae bacterium]
MKKQTLAKAAALLLSAVMAFGLSACGGGSSTGGSFSGNGSSSSQENAGNAGDDGKASSVNASFDLNYDGAPAAQVQQVAEGDVAEEPAAPERENYQFTGWYTSADASAKFDFEEALYEDTTIYAGWKKTGAMVTFVDNYEGGSSTPQTVVIGETAVQPASPARDGYLFTAWYMDEACTTAYDFSSAVEDDMTLYAGWEEESGDTVSLTYYWNYEDAPGGGIATVERINTNSKTSAYTAAREGFLLAGWFTDEECTSKFDFSKRVKESVKLYAKWLDTYTFEAEYVDFSGMIGNGYSGNQSGVGLIVKQKDENQASSNGHYVGWMYRYGNTLTFNIESDKEVSDAVLVLRLSAEFYDMSFTSSTLQVEVNGEPLKYDSFSITGVPAQGTNQWRTFSNFTINNAVSLKEGSNTIRLIVNNEDRLGESGTMYATAPLFDCMYLYTDANLSWTPLTENLEGNIS